MRGNRGAVQTGILLAGFLSCTVLAEQAKDPLVADQYTLIPGNRTTIADTLVGKHNVFLDFDAENEDGTVNAVITNPAGTTAKWDVDVKTGRLFWGLTNKTPRSVDYLGFPCNVGIVPRTRDEDGAPLDILVMGGMLLRGAVVSAKVIGILYFKSNGLKDNMLLAVFRGSFMDGLNTLTEFNAQYPGIASILETWFVNYKGINGGIIFNGFGDADAAQTLMRASIVDTDADAVPADYAERADDSLTAPGFSRNPGAYGNINGILGSCDTLFCDKNMYRDFPATNDDGTVNAFTEIPAGTNDKWETDHDNGKLFWENKNGSPRIVKYLGYPLNYGMVPGTVYYDGDPLDIVVLGPTLLRGSITPVKVIGILSLIDQEIVDDKLVAVVPGSTMGEVNTIAELNSKYPGVSSIMGTWFSNYKGIGGGVSSKGLINGNATAILDTGIMLFKMPVKRRSVFTASGCIFKAEPPNRNGTNGCIAFSIPRAERVVVTMYTVSGEKITTIVDDRFTAGPHKVSWNMRNIPAGFFVMEMRAGSFTRAQIFFLYR